jgi:hypothetical protein
MDIEREIDIYLTIKTYHSLICKYYKKLNKNKSLNDFDYKIFSERLNYYSKKLNYFCSLLNINEDICIRCNKKIIYYDTKKNI